METNRTQCCDGGTDVVVKWLGQGRQDIGDTVGVCEGLEDEQTS